MLRCLLRSRYAWLRPAAPRVPVLHLEHHLQPCTRYLHQPSKLPREAGGAPKADRDRFWDANGKPTAELYDHYLSIDVKPRPHQGSPWVHELDAAACLEALPQHLRSEPMACFQQQDVDLELAGRCMEALVVSQHKQASTAEARKSITERRAGSCILLWLIKSSRYGELDLSLHPRFLRAMIHCLIAEGGAEDVTTWLLVSSGKNHSGLDRTTRVTRAWKGHALRHLLESSMFWAGNDINAAIAAYGHALRLGVTPVASDPQNYVPKHPAGSWLV